MTTPTHDVETPRQTGKLTASKRCLGWRWLFALAAVAVVLSSGLMLRTAWASQEKGVATATLSVARRPPSLLDNAERTPGTEPEDFHRFKRAQVALIKSRRVLEMALADPNVSKLDFVRRQEDPVAWLGSNLVVEGAGDDEERLRLSFSGENPQISVVVKAIALAYLKVINDSEGKERFTRRDELQRIYYEYEKKLEQKRLEVRKLEQTVGAHDREDPAFLSREYTETRRELRQMRLSKVAAEVRLSRARGKKEAAADKVEKLEEEVAVLSAQETWLADEADRLRKRLKETEDVDRYYTDNIRDSIKTAETMAERIGAELERLNVELRVPPRVRLVD
jgi:hypothetical protein